MRSGTTSIVPSTGTASGSSGSNGKPCSTAFVTSSVIASSSAEASSVAIVPKLPTRRVVTRARGEDRSGARRSPLSRMSSKSSASSSDWLSASWTTAMTDTRRIASSIADFASVDDARRDCRRSSADTVCRLFFTRWCISRMSASRLSSSRSRRRISDTSRPRMTAPVRLPSRMSGIDRRAMLTRPDSISVRHGARPVSTSGSDSSTVPR